MTISAPEGPVIAYGQNPPVAAGAAPGDYNSDRAPSLADLGQGIVDPQYGYANGGGAGSPLAFGFAPGINYTVVDQVPSTAATANIAALQTVANGTAMTLVNASGAGITVMTAPLAIKPTGLVVPACLAIDGVPGFQSFGQSGAIQAWDPTKILSRAVSVTAAASATGGNFLITGYDYRGNKQTAIVTAVAATTVNSTKAFKFIISVVPQFTDGSHDYSIGTADVYGFPLRADVYGYVYACFNNDPITTPTFVAADTTSPATDATGDVRGTLAGITANNAKRLQIMQGVSPANLAALTPNSFVGIFGVTPA